MMKQRMWLLTEFQVAQRAEQRSGDWVPKIWRLGAIQEFLGYWELRSKRNWQIQAWADLSHMSLSTSRFS